MTRTGRCVCGIRVALHYHANNQKLSCEETKLLHPRAAIKPASVWQQFSRLVTKERHGCEA